MVGELEGGAKKDESMLGLMRAWRFLQRRFGTRVRELRRADLARPQAIGDRREELTGRRRRGEPRRAARSSSSSATRSSSASTSRWCRTPPRVAACALLGERRRGLFRAELALRMQQLVDLLRLQDVQLTPALLRDEGDFSDSIAFAAAHRT